MRNYKVAFISLAIAFLCIGCVQAKERGKPDIDLAADFKLLDLNQGGFTLSSFKDKKPVLLFFWTTWCPYCRKALKLINQEADQLKNSGLELAVINVGESPSKVKSFLESNSLTLNVFLDRDGSVAGSYNIFGVPTYVLINKSGFIEFKDNYLPEDNIKRIIAE